MSKTEGKKIVIKFTEELIDTGLTQITDIDSQEGIWSTSPGGSAVMLRDGDESTLWQIQTNIAYVQITGIDIELSGIKFFNYSGWAMKTYDLQTSPDGISYTSLKKGTALVNWNTILLDTTVNAKYIRIYFTRVSSYGMLGELILLKKGYDHQTFVNDLIVTGSEYLYVNGPNNNGPLIEKQYGIRRVQFYGEEKNTLLITIKDQTPFNSVTGELTIKYDQLTGNLAGLGGPISSFEEKFIPLDLVSSPDPAVAEYIDAKIDGLIACIFIEKIPAYLQKEYIDVSFAGSINCIYIDPTNP